MKLGLITDIHEQTDHLRTALRLFRSKGVEQVVVIGDLFAMGQRIEETCQLLSEVKTVGVWGNHDYGLCVNLDDDMRKKYPPVVLDYIASLRPRLDVGGCHFTHVEPWHNPETLTRLRLRPTSFKS